MVRRALLDGQGDDVPCALVGLFLGLGLHLAHHHGGVVVGVLLHAVDQDLLGLVRGHAGHALQLVLLAGVHLVGLGLQALGLLVLLVQGLFTGLQVVQFFVKCLFALVHPALEPRYLAAAVTNFFIKLRLQADDLFLGLQYGFLLFLLSLVGGVLQHIGAKFLRLADLLFHAVFAVQITGKQANGQRNQRNQCDDWPTQNSIPLLSNLFSRKCYHTHTYLSQFTKLT